MLKDDKAFTKLRAGEARVIKYTVKTKYLPKYKAKARYTLKLGQKEE